MNKKIVWSKYIITSMLTMVILTLVSYSYFFYDTFISYDVAIIQDEDISQDLVMYKIEELKQENDYWNNAGICYKIGTLYEKIYLFDLATKYYLRSIEVSGKHYFVPHFKLARLNMARSKFSDAIFVINLVPDVNNKSIKQEKGYFYQDLSIQYANKNRIDDAIWAMQKATLYFKSVDSEIYKYTKKEYAYLLMKKSENLIDQNDIAGAMDLLEKAQKSIESAELYYRLAVLNYGNNDKKSFKYFEKTQNMNPSIINYDLYYKLLLQLKDDADARHDIYEAKFYKQKINNLKRYVDANFISEGDAKLLKINGTLSSSFWGVKRYVNISFDISNNTPHTYRNLKADIDLNVNGTDILKTVSITDQKGIVLPYSNIKNIHVKIDISKVLGHKTDIHGKIYLYKNAKFNKIEIGEFSL